MASITDAEGVIYLIGCALHHLQPDEAMVKDLPFAKAYTLAKRHSLAALSYYGLGERAALVPKEIRDKWEGVLYRSARKNALMDAEREKFFAFCESSGIRYMPLKGILLQRFYPAPGTREMADNDILFDAAHDEEVKAYFLSNGFSAEAYRISNHDVYHKMPFYNFELHRGLFHALIQNVRADYFKDPFSIAVSDGMSAYGHCFQAEDFYAYIMAHGCKHFSGGGTGLRTLVDCYICRHTLSMEREKLDSALGELGILSFERDAAALSEKLFACPEKLLETMRSLSEAELETMEYYLSSGTYGTMQRRIENAMRALAPEEKRFSLRTKLRYLWSILMPDRTFMEIWCAMYAPFFLRHKGLMWLSPFWRIAKKGFQHTAELRLILKKDENRA